MHGNMWKWEWETLYNVAGKDKADKVTNNEL